jgi:8-oxo-dGTP diphosphatase
MTAPRLERRIVGVMLVDADGRLLLQHRDAHAPVSPNQWTMPGGGIEPGEDPEEAGRRELLEETGLRVAGPLALFWSGMRPSSRAPDDPSIATEWYIYYARTTARQEDVIVGEGQAMIFTPLEQALALDLGFSARFFIPRFFASPEYRRLSDQR